MRKKLLPHGLAVLIISAVVLAGCGGGNSADSGGGGGTTQPEPKYKLTVNIEPAGAGRVDTVILPETAKSSYNIEEDQTVRLTAKAKSGYLFDHWEGDLSSHDPIAALKMDGEKTVTAYFISGQTVNIPMRNIPGAAVFPIGANNSEVCATVNYPYLMAETEVTYEQWYTVKTWAVNNGYRFYYYGNDAGSEGSEGTIGAAPTADKRHPVTSVSWYDAIVWCNALTEYYNRQNGTDLEYAYKYHGEVVKDATNTTACEGVSDGVNTTGFRLPTSMEWELAARYRGSDSTNAIECPTGSGIYWTKGRSASGAIAGDTNYQATGEVAWYCDNSGLSTHPVAGKPPNALDLFDMSGNASEWCFDVIDVIYGVEERVKRGGSCGDYDTRVWVSYVGNQPLVSASWDLGFRVVRTP